MGITRRSVLAAFGLALGTLAAPARWAFAGGTTRRLTILHTNDLHGHLTPWVGWEGELKGRAVGGLARLAAAVRAARADAGGDVLLLDAGDLLGDTMIADLTRGRAPIRALNSLRYDAMTVGNHEPDFGARVLAERMGDATFPVVAANLARRGGGKPFAPPYVIKTVGGVRVGILGLAYPKTPRTTAAKNVEGLDFQEPVAAVRRHLPQMRREGAELSVVLSHLGLGGDEHLARSVEGIDVIVGGHSHNRMPEAQVVGRTLIVQAGAHGSDLGRLDLDLEGGRVVAHRRTLIPLVHDDVPADAEAEAFLATLLAPHEGALNEVIGRASGWLVRAQTLAGQDARKRDEESPVDSLFADILRAETKADVALLPGVGYGVAIPPGEVTASQLRQLVPHGGEVVTMRLSGAEILKVLEQAVENATTDDPAAKIGGMIQISGLRFRYDPGGAKGGRVLEVEHTEGAWDPSAEYTVATSSMLASGGHNYRTLTLGRERAGRGAQYEVIREWFAKNSPVATPRRGRIERLRGEP
jgi:5'-nucleotidase/UDP-sugar diphosphatase